MKPVREKDDRMITPGIDCRVAGRKGLGRQGYENEGPGQSGRMMAV